ncbi:unnamed protein product [Rotaria magnacalcarata]|uniref:Uncharacterized protein n=1 Tax=Rotaria magnacalcarata TaxID=392030 RepID=A0A816R3C7_9BILA|nr:unnamed protein product [Rotaria magnacalcarata]
MNQTQNNRYFRSPVSPSQISAPSMDRYSSSLTPSTVRRKKSSSMAFDQALKKNTSKMKSRLCPMFNFMIPLIIVCAFTVVALILYGVIATIIKEAVATGIIII